MKLACKAVLSLLLAAGHAEGYSFVTIGDWGGANLGGSKARAESAVALQMGKTAAALDAQFVVNVGDNFYYCGVHNVSDPQFKTDFEDIFTQSSLGVKWYSILGNHDYGYNVEAQLKYKSPVNDRWVMPERYYAKRIEMTEGHALTMIFLDSNPCIRKYRSDNPSGWDPCSGKYGDCPGCKFHENIIAESCTDQLAWLETTIAAVPADDWVIIVAHHPLYEIDAADFYSVLNGKFDLYLNGHTHNLDMYLVDGKGSYVTSGAGTMVPIPVDTAAAAKEAARPVDAAHTHTYTWTATVAGFTSHTFSSDFSSLATSFVAYNGTVINQIVHHKK